MREIKFRARYENHSWVTGSFLKGYFSSRHGQINAILYNKNSKTLRIPIDINTLGQYTGLKDKNEVEIYFGDIVSKYHDDDSEDKDIRVVEQIEGHTEIGCFSYYEDSLDFKVIGNIHENPELR
tara:strand:- start:1164 stop:1535 length:372 start_codon:yes stop_codon:yes gene_type:complete